MKDFVEFATGPLRLPINSKIYTIPPVNIATGLMLRAAVDQNDVAAIEQLNGAGPEDAYRRILGAAFDEMKADGVPWEALDRAYLTAITDHQRGRLIAEVVWEVGHDPKATQGIISAAVRIARNGVAEAGTTPIPNSSKPTNISRVARTKRTPKAPAPSAGGTS